MEEPEQLERFQFPSNGKAHSDWIETLNWLKENWKWFPFPSNGKAHSDELKMELKKIFARKVSIPFKREGTFRLFAQLKPHWSNYQVFPFPSNGKAHSDNEISIILKNLQLRFHSLQTGRHIQTRYLLARMGRGGSVFHSLQTGRHIQTHT